MLRGTLDDFTLPDVLRLVSLAHKTGVLTISRPGGKGTIYFRTGDAYYAETSTTPRSVGQRLVDDGVINSADLDSAIDRSNESGRPVGEILIGTSGLSSARLERAVREQIHDAAFEAMRWGEGEFSWQDALEVGTEVDAAVSVDDLILEAAHRLDELAVRERKVVAEDSVPTLSAAFASAATPITISPDQWRILALLDGRRSARQVALLAGLDVEEALRDLYRLVTGGVVEIAPAQEAQEARPPPPLPEEPALAEPPPAGPSPRRTRKRAAAPPPEEDFAAFQQVAMASAENAPSLAPPPASEPAAPVPAAPESAIEAFDTPRPEEMTTRVPRQRRAPTPPPPPPAAPAVRPPADTGAPPGAGDVEGALAGVRIDDSTSQRIAAAAGTARPEGGAPEAGGDEVDPALIARLIQGVKDL